MQFFFFIICILPLSLTFAQSDIEDEKVFSIYFGGGSYFIDQEQLNELYNFLEGVDDFNIYEIEIHGHTDNIGSRDYNQWLSYMRSNNVLEQLVYRNIPKEIIKVYDFGEDSPLYSNGSWNGKLHNRRVDIIIKKLAS